jgi:hypothetical protein
VRDDELAQPHLFIQFEISPHPGTCVDFVLRRCFFCGDR